MQFVLALDANAEPTAWDKIAWAEETFLEHLKAEIVTVTDSNITCVGAKNAEGGTNIDYCIGSIALLGNAMSVTTDFSVPFSPHFGICLELDANPSNVEIRTLTKPDMPKNIRHIETGEVEEHSFQNNQKACRQAQAKKTCISQESRART